MSPVNYSMAEGTHPYDLTEITSSGNVYADSENKPDIYGKSARFEKICYPINFSLAKALAFEE
ncbi:hypothetical protein PtA15_3A604 [Puccinia triticina]|uniref:Uncharacterized protein n=1 Tax=Puccinia triticina TaxID=208348 RepID=A0ABY7CEP1_9BASI|nr:uncharacterized protein PtA15_3A604 [Puccinia triticina]WAQ83235.1 hypothetical protein PtA15_3A604 [Puccinia triticina]